MIILEKLILLRGVTLFKKVSDELLAEIANYAEEERVQPGEYIIKKGELGDALYIIVAGRVGVMDENKLLAEFGSHQIFGEIAFLSPEPRTASVVALEECLLLKLRRQDLFDNFGLDVNLSIGIIDELCQRMRDMAKQIQDLAKKSS